MKRILMGLLLMPFMALAKSHLYMVVDLSGGATATTYPISYLSDVPEGGWTDEYKTTKLVLRRIEPGSFIMGGDQTDESHRVTLTTPYYIGVFELTQKQWTLVMGSNPSADYGVGDAYPVYNVSYDMMRGSSSGSRWPSSSAVDTSSFVGKLRVRTGVTLDLPTDAQWEYACRAGTATTYYWGNAIDGNYLWYSDNAGSMAHVVGTKKPNAWGLYDMSGNLSESSLDWIGTQSYGKDPVGPSSGSYRTIRGGSIIHVSYRCESASRFKGTPSHISSCDGFRLAWTMKNNSTGGTIIFNPNGGSEEIDPMEIAAGEDVGNLPVISRKGYVFLGWYTAKEGGEIICRGRELNGDMTAHAHWVKESQIENATDEKGGFVCVQYNSAFALNSLSDALACVTNAAAWINTPSAKRYKTIAMGAGPSDKKESPFGQVSFPGLEDTTGEYSHFVVTSMGTVAIPEVGSWSFDCGHDDGFKTVISGNGVSFVLEDAEPTNYKHTTATFDFPVAGKYEVMTIYYQCAGEAELDFSVAKGTYSAFDASAFKLVGDPASGIELVVPPDMPELSPATGSTFEESLTISMSCAAKDTTIHYTTDGSDPTAESPTYTNQFCICGKTTVKAIAVAADGLCSDVAVAEYALGTCEDPVVTPSDGTVFQHSNKEVSIGCGEEGTLRYTLDGSDPTADSPEYTEPFTIDETTTVKAKVFSDRFFDSHAVTANLTREWVKVVAPTVMTSVASSGLSVLVDLGCEDSGAALHYTLDGSEPTAESPTYTKPFYAFDAATLKAVAVRDDFANSDVLSRDIAIYCVVDLSGGSVASSYPVSYIAGIPSGGWTDEYKTTKLVLRKIDAGSFIMGDDQTNEAHRVTLTKPFYMGVFEVTQKQWTLVMGSNPSSGYGVGDTYPVYNVSYDMIRGSSAGAQWPTSSAVDGDSFAGRLQARTGIDLDLPTEAQWEYACRAGTTTTYYWGDSMDGDYTWSYSNSGRSNHVVGTRIPNKWGLFDMSGNAWEWCLDWAGELMFGVDAKGPTSGACRIQRGGGAGHKPDIEVCSSSGRWLTRASSTISWDFGVRIAFVAHCSPPPVISPASGTTFEESLTVSMSCAAKDTTIHYTTDGSDPTAESTTYARKFRIYGKTTVKAVAFYEDGTTSEVAVAEYAKWRDDPVIRPKDGTVFEHSGQRVSITHEVEDGVVRYTTDGSEPTADSAVYVGPFAIDETTTVKAKLFGDQCFDSDVLTATLTRVWVPAATPVIAAAPSFTGSKQKVVLSCATAGAAIYYTTDGSEPTPQSARYGKPFYVTDSATVKAYAVMDDYLDSDVATLEIVRAWGIGDTMGKPDHAFETGGDAGFVRVEDATATLGESMRSGEIKNCQTSVLSTVVVGPGTLTFKWKTSCEEDEYHEWDHAEFAVDGEVIKVLDGETDWVSVSRRIEGDGEHTVTWAYVKDDVEAAGEDCVWVSDYGWATDYTETQTTDVPVPYNWLREKSRDIVDEYDNYERVAKQTAYNGRLTVEQCYVAGVEPESATSDFRTVIEMVDGVPHVTWEPDKKAEREYKIWGSETIEGGGDWHCPTNALDRFFKVTVEMP